MYFSEDEIVNSIVGPGTRFKGEIELSGIFRVDGDYIGSLRIDGQVIIGSRARAACTIHANSVVVGGVFCGNIVAKERVILLSSCVVIGSVMAPTLVVEEGTLLHGEFMITNKKAGTYSPVKKKGFSYVPEGAQSSSFLFSPKEREISHVEKEINSD